MDVYYSDEQVTLYLGDSLDILPTLADDSVDAICTDPPYELAFMGRSWDGTGIAYSADVWRQRLRVLKPGGHLLAFGGSRTYHRMAVAVEDAGFDIRDSLHWIYGSGFPKSMDVSKAIDKAAGAERKVVGHTKAGASSLERVRRVEMGYREHLTNVDTSAIPVTVPATADAARWNGWGTALKPAHEPIVLARKPFTGTVAGNVLQHGTGALNIDATRTQAGQDYREKCASVVGLDSNRNGDAYGEWTGVREDSAHAAGRWPTNVLLTHPPLVDEHGQPVGDACANGCVPGCLVAEMDQQSAGMRAAKPSKSGSAGADGGGVYGGGKGLSRRPEPVARDDAGASRFFPVFRYQAKAPASERPRLADGTAWPTVKPLALMRWLVRLVTPPGGTVLDPFAGSGTTLEAARLEGFPAIGIERDPDAAGLCRVRLDKPYSEALFGDTG